MKTSNGREPNPKKIWNSGKMPMEKSNVVSEKTGNSSFNAKGSGKKKQGKQ